MEKLSRNGGVCLYFKDNLLINERCDLETVPETIVAEIKLNKNKIFFVLSYCYQVLQSLDPHSKHTIIHGTSIFRTPCLPPPPPHATKVKCEIIKLPKLTLFVWIC